MNNIRKRFRAWAEINLDNLIYNFNAFKKSKVCCVVKANAYGHGAVECAKVLQSIGADYLAVSNIEEAVQLRKASISMPILILGYTPVQDAILLYKYNIEQTVYNRKYAKELDSFCAKNNITIKIHIKIDTGMGRLGFRFHDGCNELDDALATCRLSHLNVFGVYTHFSCSSEENDDFTDKQYKYFEKALLFFEKNQVSFTIKHCSNTSASIRYPKFDLDMIRLGIGLYGINSLRCNEIRLKPVLSLYSVVTNVKLVHKGDTISYGGQFVAYKSMHVATISIGYGDGLFRTNSGNFVYINGNKCKILGCVCMDQIMVECENCKIGDVVEIYGKNMNVSKSADYNNTIPYEVLTSISLRIPRIYIKNKKYFKTIFWDNISI